MRILTAIVTVLALVTAAGAGTKADDKACVQVAQLQMAPHMARPALQGAQIDREALCHQDRGRIEASIRGLRSSIAGAQTQLSQMQGLSFRCLDKVTSTNNKGVIEYCTPNACLPDTGRCANEIRTSDDCAPGYYWDSDTGTCVPPTPGRSD